MAHYKGDYDKKLLSKSYDETKFYIILTDEILPIMCSGGYNPEFTFDEVLLNTPADFENPDAILDLCTFSIIGTDKGSAVVFSWQGHQPTCEKLVASIPSIPTDKLVDTIIKFAMEFFENIAISPNWYDALDKNQKDHIGKRINATIHDPRCFKEDSPTLVSSISFEVKSNITPNNIGIVE
jgi:hypothetical protein